MKRTYHLTLRDYTCPCRIIEAVSDENAIDQLTDDEFEFCQEGLMRFSEVTVRVLPISVKD